MKYYTSEVLKHSKLECFKWIIPKCWLLCEPIMIIFDLLFMLICVFFSPIGALLYLLLWITFYFGPCFFLWNDDANGEKCFLNEILLLWILCNKDVYSLAGVLWVCWGGKRLSVYGGKWCKKALMKKQHHELFLHSHKYTLTGCL